jgi:hypothetical protein
MNPCILRDNRVAIEGIALVIAIAARQCERTDGRHQQGSRLCLDQLQKHARRPCRLAPPVLPIPHRARRDTEQWRHTRARRVRRPPLTNAGRGFSGRDAAYP